MDAWHQQPTLVRVRVRVRVRLVRVRHSCRVS